MIPNILLVDPNTLCGVRVETELLKTKHSND